VWWRVMETLDVGLDRSSISCCCAFCTTTMIFAVLVMLSTRFRALAPDGVPRKVAA
jgi:hypothetical protein